MKENLFYSDVFTGAYVENTEVLAKGVDVSVYQHKGGANGWLPLDWQKVREAGFEFAILKAGSTPRLSEEGVPLGGPDATFEMDYRDAREAGMALGAYFYTYASTPEGIRADAELLISWLDGKQFEYPIFFDLEDPSLKELGKDTLTELSVTFISTLQEHGYYGALYSNNEWLTEYLHANTLKAVFDVWYARYPLISEDPIAPTQVFAWNPERYGTQLGLWQYTQYGVIDGIDDISFDFNYAYRDYPSLIKKYGYNGFPIS
jgi:GH25 family lysozyme M1 (1,4-beta-N-acetylmuramidase)